MVFPVFFLHRRNAMSKPYFDLHVTGVGYLGRAREVSVRRGEPFLAVEVNALHGSAEQVEYTRFDCRVTGAEARAVIQRHLESINDRDRKVLAGFRLGDLYADLFTYRSGEKLGQARSPFAASWGAMGRSMWGA